MELFSGKAPVDDDDSDYCWWSHFLSDCGYAPNVPLFARLPPEQGWQTIPAPEVAGDWSAEALLDVPSSSRRRRAGKSRVTYPISSGDSSASCDETDEDAADSVAPDNYNLLFGDSPPFHNREYGSSSQVAMGFSLEAEDDGRPPHDSFFGTSAMEGDNTTFTFAELGLSTEQYPSASVKAYVPMPIGGYPAVGTAPEGGSDFIDQLFSCGIMSPCFVPVTSSFPPWENTRSPFLAPQAYSAFQVGDTTCNDGGLQQTDYNPEPSALPSGERSFDPYSTDLPSSQGLCGEQPNFIRPSSPEMEERNSSPGNSPPLNDSGSLPLEVDTLVRAVVRAENPPSIEAVRCALEQNTAIAFHTDFSRDCWMTAVEEIWDEVCRLHAATAWDPYDQWIQALESDMCSLTSEADEFDSRANEAHKRQKTRESKMAAERDRIARLQCELDEARSSLDQQTKEVADASEEEVTFAGGGTMLCQSVSSKAKEVERLKRKKPRCLCFAA
ncbi:hypothetical protein Taro_014498 [Colocasia esculenta]|uniref:Uncharacterized protein n=1 Tax=Colocasia esculenta TaxID=4460 RepID=A0A843UEY1_COLES|nr:hypothetical protein [Colocasia esculenta]